MTRATIAGISPFFVVGDVRRSIGYYRDKLDFAVMHEAPADDPFFAIVVRDGAMLFLKAGEAAPQPNASRDPNMRWDAYLSAPDPDALADEFAARGIDFAEPLRDTDDGLRGFELTDPDGYALFFGRPK